jgi:hypothetical protein
VIVDVEATTAVRQAEVTAQRRMIERSHARFGLLTERLAADAGYDDARNLSWLVEERGIEPHIPVSTSQYGATARLSAPSSSSTMMTTAVPAPLASGCGSDRSTLGKRALSSMQKV